MASDDNENGIAVLDVNVNASVESGRVVEAGEWKCKCGNINYAHRERCNMRRCREPRPQFNAGVIGRNVSGEIADLDLDEPGKTDAEESNTIEDDMGGDSDHGKKVGKGDNGVESTRDNSQAGNDSKKNKKMREGDWICKKCGNINFATRLRCNMRKCQAPREEWVCKACNNINYKFRTVCNMRKCQAPRPQETYPDYILNRGHGNRDYLSLSAPSSIGHSNYPQLQALLGPGIYDAGGGFTEQPFDGHHSDHFGGHFRDREHFRGHPGDHFSGHPSGHDFHGPPGFGYRRSDELSNANGHRRNRGGDSFPREIREGDWTCLECGNVNFANRTHCNMRKCRAEKPQNIPSHGNSVF